MQETQSFFIIGTQRSGTTLLRLLLNMHSKISVPRETPFLMPLLNAKYAKRPIPGSHLKTYGEWLISQPEYQSTFVADYQDLFLKISKQKEITLKNLIEELFVGYSRKEGKIIWG